MELAPHPWDIEDHTATRRAGYFSIVDADGNRICDFFPFAGKGGRGKGATLAIARQIIEWERAAQKASP
jgi:hypothetical protein